VTSVNVPVKDITAVILAGGRGRRMQEQDKGLLEHAGKPLVEHVIDAIRPQVGRLIINANRNLDSYRQYGYDVIEDRPGGYLGPLAGLSSALQQIDTDLILMVPCDMPRLPADLVSRLWVAMQRDDAAIAVAHDGRRMHPVVALMKRMAANALPAAVDAGLRKAQAWVEQQHFALADFSDEYTGFSNLNTSEDFRHGAY
jgi:molybdopterin-guanine dinucleotide biosynthesis protein A